MQPPSFVPAQAVDANDSATTARQTHTNGFVFFIDSLQIVG
jgi:hypothetical protein